MNVKEFINKFAWVIAIAIAVVFLTIGVAVYYAAPPSTVTEVIPGGYHSSGDKDKDEFKPSSYKDIMNTLGDLEVLPCVTNIGIYYTNNDVLNIYYKTKNGKEIPYGVVEDPNADRNYTVECFVYSNISNKNYIRVHRTFNMSMRGDGCSLEELYGIVDLNLNNNNNDLQKDQDSRAWLEWYTFLRITVKPGYNDINLIYDKYLDSLSVSA